MRSIMQAAKYLFKNESKTRPDEGEKACESPSLLVLLPNLSLHRQSLVTHHLLSD